MRSFLHRFSADTVLSAFFVLTCVAVVVWLRLLPWSLPAAGALAETILERQLREQIAPDIMRREPADRWRDAVAAAARDRLKNGGAEIAVARAKLASEIKSQLSFVGEDGRSYAYLGDYDSYVWLRNARNYLRHGTTCDVADTGECRDTYGDAPVGYRMIYNRSLHIAAIVGVHRIATFFHPGYPLAASAFLVPVIIGALGVLPAFFIGRRLGGNIGGAVAALMISLDPAFLVRSVGSDNDVWNVVMPLFIAWAVCFAFTAGTKSSAAAFAALAALTTGLYAAVWRGWVFTFIVVMTAAAAWLILAFVRRLGRDGLRRAATGHDVRRLAGVAGVYYISSGVFTWLAGAPFFLPFNFSALLGSARGSERATAWWPVVYSTVSELSRPLASDLALFMGGTMVLLAGWLGLLCLVLPQQRMKKRHLALVVWTVALFAVHMLFGSTELPKTLFVIGYAAPFAVELLYRAWKNEPGETNDPVALFVLVWFFASLYQVFAGVRFLIFFAVPFGFAVGAFAGRLRTLLQSAIDRCVSNRALVSVASGAIALAVVVYPLQRGYTTMAGYYPAVNDAWWDSLVAIRKQSAADAIVNTWWDYGYWVKYAAERRVSSDGGSLATHVPHWLAKSFVASSDQESRGILRMLNCGSDATPLPEGRYGAFGKLAAMGVDEYRAYGFLLELVRLDRAASDRYLADRGFSAERRASILASTHCTPAESFLVISKEIITKAEWWMTLGSWDVRRAYLAKRTRLFPETQALEDLKRLGYRPADGKVLYDTVAGLKSPAEIDDFIAPPQRLIPSEWIPCNEGAGGMSCRITITNETGGGYLYFNYDSAAPKNARLKDGRREGSVAALVVAGSQGLEEVLSPAAVFPDIGVLLDLSGRRILIGSPLLVRSTLVRLFYLGDRYSKVFKSLARRRTLLGEEVATFKIDWRE
jgi:dolichyl-diphosphooligosaccharide--protein glycosyltransferase